MRILYYCPEYYSWHGGRSHARGFFHALEKLPTVSQCFLYPKGSPQTDSKVAHNKKSSAGKLWFLPATVRKIVQFFVPKRALTRALINELRTNDCDAIVIRTGVKFPILKEIKKAFPNILICLEINSAYFDESFPGLPLKHVFQQWEVRRFDCADALLVVSSYLKNYLEGRGVSPEKVLVNQNGVDIDAISLSHVDDVREQFGIPKEAFVLGYIGGMETFRRLPEVVACVAELWRAGADDVYLLIVGDGAHREAVLAAIQAEDEAFGKAVLLAGWQEHARIPGFLKTFDLAIFPFTNDYCSPLKLFEYLGAGVPTIGPDTSAVREVFEDGVHLKLVKQDGSDFVNTILELRNNTLLRNTLGQAGKELVLKEYTWEKNAERVVAHIKNRFSVTQCQVSDYSEQGNIK